MGKIFDWMYFSYLEMKHAKAKARGKTVRHETDWLGRKKKIVEDHYRGTRKTYSYGHGFFGDVTKTETTRGGRLIEVGEVKRPLLLIIEQKFQNEAMVQMSQNDMKKVFLATIF